MEVEKRQQCLPAEVRHLAPARVFFLSLWLQHCCEINQSINQSNNHSINQSIEWLLTQSINQMITHSINQSIGWLRTPRKDLCTFVRWKNDGRSGESPSRCKQSPQPSCWTEIRRQLWNVPRICMNWSKKVERKIIRNRMIVLVMTLKRNSKSNLNANSCLPLDWLICCIRQKFRCNNQMDSPQQCNHKTTV